MKSLSVDFSVHKVAFLEARADSGVLERCCTELCSWRQKFIVFRIFTFIFMKIPICFGQQDGKAILSAALSGVQFIRSDYGNETSFIATTKISEIEVSAPVIHSDVPLET